MSRLAGPIARLVATLKAAAGVAVTYRRGADTVAVTAIKTAIDRELVAGDGGVIEARRIDWIVQADELTLAGAVTEPAEGDLIDEVIGEKTYQYEVMPAGTESHYRPINPSATAWRVHSKLIQVT